MMNTNSKTRSKWLYPAIYLALILISFIPSYAEISYPPQAAQDVIISLLRVAIEPYRAFAPIFHLATLLIVIGLLWKPARMGRLVAAYMGVNYLIIALAQSMGHTEKYGFVVHIAALATMLLLGTTWLFVAFRDELHLRARKPSLLEIGLLLLALLAYWGPYRVVNEAIQADFDPLLLLTSPDYGLTFCFTTPVFLLGLILFGSPVNRFAYRITAFSGLLYALFNLTHWFNPETRWMGFLHLPLLIISAYALFSPGAKGKAINFHEVIVMQVHYTKIVIVFILLLVGCGPTMTSTSLPSSTDIPATLAESISPTSTLVTTSKSSPTVAPIPKPTSLDTAGHLIAFSSDLDGDFEIWVMNSDGSSLQKLTDNDAMDLSPAWSPNGDQIAFVSNRDGNDEIYLMNANGTRVHRLTHTSDASESFPAWSPDGLQISFDSDRGGNWDIYVVRSDGTAVRQLTDHPADDWISSWSPDNNRITFESNRDGNYEIYTMNADGSNQQRLTHNADHDGFPSWSPDGSKIAFLSRQAGNYDIYVMGIDGSNAIRLTDHPTEDSSPSWSPDCTHMVFTSQRNGNDNIYIMNADGSDVRQLTANGAQNWRPSWQPKLSNLSHTVSPAGLIVFYSERDGDADIYLMNPDGSDQRPLTDNDADDTSPAWSPDGSLIAFESDRDDPSPHTCFPNCNYNLYVMNADGSNQRRLTNLPGAEWHANWSPDGKSLLFTAGDIGYASMGIYRLGLDGGEPQSLLVDDFENDAADWSPDGAQIAFSSNREGSRDIFVMNADGGNVRKVVDTGLDDHFPDWSPDGSQIAFFATDWPSIRQDIFTVNADGSNLQNLTNTPTIVDEDPNWSPDGTQIIFQSDRDRNFEIYVMNTDGSQTQNLSNHKGRDYWPEWWAPGSAVESVGAPDSKIAFVSVRDGNGEIYVMNANGSEPQRLTNWRLWDGFPDWSPNGSQIAYYSYINSKDWVIKIMNADGSDLRRLTNSPGDDFNSVWQP